MLFSGMSSHLSQQLRCLDPIEYLTEAMNALPNVTYTDVHKNIGSFMCS